ncbi:MAG: hypothetical protein QOH88_3487 [Verrucomicrobiota bacterium]|jgi:hypothetical protein
MKNKLSIITACIAALALCTPGAAFAAKKPTPTPAPGPSASPPARTTTTTATTKPTETTKAPRAIPFRGKISAVDQKAKSFTIAGKEKSRVFKITTKTMLTKAGAAATMKDVTVNEEVRGSYWKMTDGSLEAKTVKLGPMTDAEKAAAEKHAKKKKAPKTDASPSPSPAPSATP